MSRVDLFDREAKTSDWIQSNFWIPELNGPIWMAPYQIEAMDLALERDDQGDFRHALIVWSDVKKSAKCERADTLLWMQDGSRKRADKIEIGDLVWGYVFDSEENTGSLFPDIVTGVEEQPEEPLYEIVTNRGRSVAVTGEHLFLIEGMEGRYSSCKHNNQEANAFSWVKAKDLTVGLRVVVGLDNRDFEPELDPDFYAFGAYIGGGSSTKTAEAIDVLGKRVPDRVFRASKQEIASFLSGYFDADGSITDPEKQPRVQISWGGVNRDLLRDCRMLLESLGVNATLRKHNTKYKGDPYDFYALVVSDEIQAMRMMRILTPRHLKKRRRFDVWTEKIKGGSRQVYDTFGADRIVEINELPPERTFAIEVKTTKAHVTNGLVTHNSSLAAAVALRRAFELEWGSIKVVANDLKQARSRSYFYITRALELNPETSAMIEKGDIKITRYTIDFNFNHTKIEAIPADPKGEAGGNDDMVLFTELWTYQHETHKRLWTELVVPPNKFGKSFRWAESYAGFTGQSVILEGLYNDNVKEAYRLNGVIAPLYRNGSVFAMWNQQPRLPWQSPQYYASQRAELSDEEFRRVHRNEWIGSTSKFIRDEWWDANRVETTKGKEGEGVVVGCDAAYAQGGDTFAVVVVGKHPTDPDKLAVKEARLWTAPKNGKLDFKNMLDEEDEEYPYGYIAGLRKRYRVLEVAYDPYQLHLMATEQSKLRIVFWKEFTQGRPRSVADNELYDAIRDGGIVHNDNGLLSEHVKNAGRDRNGRLVKLSKEKKIDGAVALSMAQHRARYYRL